MTKPHIEYINKILSSEAVKEALRKSVRERGIRFSIYVHENTNPDIAELVKEGTAVLFYSPKPFLSDGFRREEYTGFVNDTGHFHFAVTRYPSTWWDIQNNFSDAEAESVVSGKPLVQWRDIQHNYFESTHYIKKLNLDTVSQKIGNLLRRILKKESRERGCYYHVPPEKVDALFGMINGNRELEDICSFLGEENKVTSPKEIKKYEERNRKSQVLEKPEP